MADIFHNVRERGSFRFFRDARTQKDLGHASQSRELAARSVGANKAAQATTNQP